ncbi:MAG: hypothetical protein B1H08_04660 [Candidatus Omnitrophica bacterium 4484_171]|nr:MAG: hypothetical protein B1H08_04660 [Candidatus Omnitrophica bacterium 4484_171]
MRIRKKNWKCSCAIKDYCNIEYYITSMQEDLQKRMEDIESALGELYAAIGIKDKKENIVKIQAKMSEASFWNNQKDAGKVVEELKDLKEDVDTWESLKGKADDISGLLGVYDSSYEEELNREIIELERRIESFRIKVFLSGRLDRADAIVEINSGAGGTESCDWVQMILRMYMRWAENKGFKAKIINEVKGDEAGFKNITFFVEGKYAYGYLKSESGVHRLVRISRAKLYELNEQQKKKELDNISGQKRKIEWGSQIRSYVLFPYLLVKDHRTNVEKHDAHAVLDGGIDDFIEGFLKSKIKANNTNGYR